MLGKYIVRKIGEKPVSGESARGGKIIGKIVEVEAYIGPSDRASHALGGKKTKRNIAEYLVGGHIYIYLVYGMYWQLNISTSLKDNPECVLIRALEPVLEKNSKFQSAGRKTNSEQIINSELKIRNLANGPGKLCRYLKLDKSFYGIDVAKSKEIWLEDRGDRVRKKDIVASARIGIDYAGHYWAKRKWRFYVKNNSFVSKFVSKN